MQEYDDDKLIYKTEDEDNNKAAVPAWIISVGIHAILISSLLYFLMPGKSSIEDIKVLDFEVIKTLPDKPEKEPFKPLDLVKTNIVVNTDVAIEETIVEVEDPIEDVIEVDQPDDSPSDVSDIVSDPSTIGRVAFGHVGRSTGVGKYGNRTGHRRKIVGRKNGMTRGTEGGAISGLWWLANHQEGDGHWDSGKYEGAGTPEVDTACTGAALLAFLGAGHTDRVGKWKKNVKKAIEWLLIAQRPNGSFDNRNYANGICTMAIAEAVGMGAGGSDARKAASLAVDYLLKQQNDSGGFNYTGPSGRDDMSVTGWCIMGLKSALVSGIKENEIKAAFKKVGALMNANENKSTTGDNSSTTKGLSWYTSGKSSHSYSAVAAIGLLVRQYLGWQRSEPWMNAVSDGQISKIPKDFDSMNVYRVYYGCLALLQQGGHHWKAWNKPVSELIIKSQRTDGDFKGSWNNNGKGHMQKGGRVLTTAFLTLCLEVYYRGLSFEIN
ncbi:MAG: hypothetical protein COA79_23335 [Planctomycetota bacterium]|nr:MAG: hypothetical protein COA79_23335 [Planctomycetota bacterium]